MAFIRIILFPISILYGFVTYIRNKLFDWNVITAASFQLPVISVGNLSVGGTGKTPHIEYLVRLLNEKYKLATLSRGYKRLSRGFVLADESSTADTLGDEAYQYKLRYPGIMVAVDEKRVNGINKLLEINEGIQVVLLDDAFQHRKVKPGLSILLTDFYRLYAEDHMLPTGNLREYRSGAKRADIIVVTKTPTILSPLTRQRILGQLRPGGHQSLYFSYIEHGPLSRIPGVDFKPGNSLSSHTVLLFAGIANPYPLERYLKRQFARLELVYFPDHHRYTVTDVEKVIRTFDRIFAKNKIIVTTEKDMVRLIQPDLLGLIRHLPVCYVPMYVRFHDEDKEVFENQILDYVKGN